jgi:hypothetical protein
MDVLEADSIQEWSSDGYDDVLVKLAVGHDDQGLVVREIYITMYDGAWINRMLAETMD